MRKDKIKFRAWDKFNENTTYSSVTTLAKFFKNIERLEEGGNLINLMQFTGLLDKNGKEIYEGDIVRGRYINDLDVEYFENDTITALDPEHPCCCCGYWEDCEVIGNIYEN